MLTLILEAMRSGKSTKLVRIMVQLYHNNSDYLFVKNSIDDRDFIARGLKLELDGKKM